MQDWNLFEIYLHKNRVYKLVYLFKSLYVVLFLLFILGVIMGKVAERFIETLEVYQMMVSDLQFRFNCVKVGEGSIDEIVQIQNKIDGIKERIREDAYILESGTHTPESVIKQTYSRELAVKIERAVADFRDILNDDEVLIEV